MNKLQPAETLTVRSINILCALYVNGYLPHNHIICNHRAEARTLNHFTPHNIPTLARGPNKF